MASGADDLSFYLSILGLLPYYNRGSGLSGPASSASGQAASGSDGQRGHGTPTGQAASFGTLSAEDRSALGRVGLGLNAVGAIAGLSPSPASVVSAISMADRVASLMGAPVATPNPWSGLLSPTEIDDIAAYEGITAAQAAADMSSMIGQQATALGQAEAAQEGGWGGRDANSPGSGERAGETGGDPGSGGGATAGDSPGGPGADAGDGNSLARGGVRVAPHGARRVTFGEAGPETAIFIPSFMRAPGIQGHERQVARALRDWLGILAPAGRR